MWPAAEAIWLVCFGMREPITFGPTIRVRVDSALFRGGIREGRRGRLLADQVQFGRTADLRRPSPRLRALPSVRRIREWPNLCLPFGTIVLFRGDADPSDRLLRDLIGVFHPELLPGYELRYFKPLEP